MTVGEQVKEYRIKKGISMERFAEMCDVSTKTIQRLENKDRYSSKVLEKVIEVTGIKLQDKYTPDQRKAIESESCHLKILAGAGAGKTKVAEEKIVNLIEGGVNPGEIIVCTFTEKAANELNVRVKQRLKENELSKGAADLILGTIHGICLRLLQEFGDKYNGYAILDSMKNIHFINRHFRKLAIDKVRRLDNSGVMKCYTDTMRFMNIVNYITENPIYEDEIPEELLSAVANYKNLLKENKYFDFNSIQETLLYELRHNMQFRESVVNKIKYIIVDEYQDVNHLQETIISELISLGIRAVVIGDADQAIYQFRGSNHSYILDFEKRCPDVEVIKLQENFRSTEGIVELAQECIRHNEQREPKDMISVNEGYQAGDIVYSEFDNRDSESIFIADRIKELMAMGMLPNEIGILIRKNDMAGSIIAHLESRNIPYEVENVNNLLETPEICAAIDIFRYLNFEINSRELINNWLRIDFGIEQRNLEVAIEGINKYIPSKWDEEHNASLFQEYLIQDIFHEFLSKLEIVSDDCDLRLEHALYNLGKFTQLINDFEIIHFDYAPENKILTFCNFLRYSENQYPEGYLDNIYRKVEGVRIMTVHKSKGLQFSAVFVPGLVKNIFPIKRMGGLSEWHYLPESAVENSEIIRAKDFRLLEDERRLFYVAVTRSRKFLFLTFADYSQQARLRSNFLNEAMAASGYIYEYNSLFCDYSKRDRWIPKKEDDDTLYMDFTTISDYFTCDYKFKLSKLYGFVQPINLRMGYGSSVHNMAKELNKYILNSNEIEVNEDKVKDIINKNFYLPFIKGAKKVRDIMFDNATECMLKYVTDNKSKFKEIEFVEKYVEVELANNLIVSGRIDLVRKRDFSGKWHIIIVDYKTGEKKPSSIEQKVQMEIYAMGYKNLTGEDADTMEVIDIEGNEVISTRKVIPEELDKTANMIKSACSNIKDNKFKKKCSKEKCKDCYNSRICMNKQDRLIIKSK